MLIASLFGESRMMVIKEWGRKGWGKVDQLSLLSNRCMTTDDSNGLRFKKLEEGY
jgi:hypothetical protein